MPPTPWAGLIRSVRGLERERTGGGPGGGGNSVPRRPPGSSCTCSCAVHLRPAGESVLKGNRSLALSLSPSLSFCIFSHPCIYLCIYHILLYVPSLSCSLRMSLSINIHLCCLSVCGYISMLSLSLPTCLCAHALPPSSGPAVGGPSRPDGRDIRTRFVRRRRLT